MDKCLAAVSYIFACVSQGLLFRCQRSSSFFGLNFLVGYKVEKIVRNCVRQVVEVLPLQCATMLNFAWPLS